MKTPWKLAGRSSRVRTQVCHPPPSHLQYYCPGVDTGRKERAEVHWCSLSLLVLQIWKGFFPLLAASMLSSQAVATRRPRKADRREWHVLSQLSTIPLGQGMTFHKCLEVCRTSLLLLQPQLTSLQASSWWGVPSPKIVISKKFHGFLGSA